MKNAPPSCATTMKLLGDYWTLRIIDQLSIGESRFCELQRDIDNVSPVTLTNRLKRLELAGLIVRMDQEPGISVVYSLSSLGREALPVIKSLNKFSEKAKQLAKIE